MTKEALEAFKALKECFITALFLVHFDDCRKCLVETNALGSAISAIFSQLVKETSQWHLIAFWFRKKSGTEMNYRVGEREILVIVEGCKHWCHYLEGSTYPICMITNHCNLRTFLIDKILSRKEARWWKKLSSLNLVIEYCPDKKNPADRPSYHPDYVTSGNDSEQTLCTVRYMTRSLVKANKTVQENREVCQVLPTPKVTSESDHASESQLAKTKSPQNTCMHTS